MQFSLAGLSHKKAPLETRESLAAVGVEGALAAFKREGCGEAVVLSTCNRFEVYLAGNGTARTPAWTLQLLEKLCGRPLGAHAYQHSGPDAVRHLLEVAAGLDSLVVGETEILGQVKTAYEVARAQGMTGKAANVLFQRAIYVGKRVRSDTEIAVGQTSVASVAVELAGSIFGSLKQSQVLILGAGAMAELAGRHFLSRKAATVTVANRTLERGRELAERLHSRCVAWEAFPDELQRADVVLCSTGSPIPVVTREMVARALEGRRGRSLFLIDIAMPRDVEEGVHGLEQVYLYRLEDLESIVAENLKSRAGEIAKARALVQEKAEELARWIDSVGAGKEISLRHASEGSPA